MENYKEKYEKALGRAKTFSQRWQGIEATDSELALKELKEIFPELKESEDEKIRKHLLRHFRNKTKEEWDGMPIKNIISWLEKQGEHANFRNKIQIGDEVTRNEDGELVNLSQFKRMVKQGKQKPTWSEEDEKMLHKISQCVYDNVVNIGIVNKVKYIDWIKSLKERVKGE